MFMIHRNILPCVGEQGQNFCGYKHTALGCWLIPLYHGYTTIHV